MKRPKPTVCLIVGVGPGIGEALARAFAYQGYDIGLITRNVARLGEVMGEIAVLGRRAQAYAADASDERALRAAIARAESELGSVEVLIYNAAQPRGGRPLSLDPQRLADEFRVNVTGALIATQAVATSMIGRGRGSIIFTGGGLAYEPAAEYASLSLGKAALRNLTQSLAQELGGHGIHVGTVTVYGFVQAGTHFDPRRIAQSYVQMHRQPPGHFDIEMIYK